MSSTFIKDNFKNIDRFIQRQYVNKERESSTIISFTVVDKKLIIEYYDSFWGHKIFEMWEISEQGEIGNIIYWHHSMKKVMEYHSSVD